MIILAVVITLSVLIWVIVGLAIFNTFMHDLSYRADYVNYHDIRKYKRYIIIIICGPFAWAIVVFGIVVDKLVEWARK